MFSPSSLRPARLDDSPALPGYMAPRFAFGAATAATVPTAMATGSALIAAAAGLLVLLAVAVAVAVASILI